MAVILDVSVPPDNLVLGRVLPLSGEASVTLESLVPISGEVVPFVRVRGVDGDAFESTVRGDPRVEAVERFHSEAEEHLFAFDWRLENDVLFDAIESTGGYVLEASGGTDVWQFRLRFPDQASVAAFDDDLGDAALRFELTGVSHETPPSSGLWYGLTEPQREALVAAIEAGYFEIPRATTTSQLADRFGISDQVFIERLRRGVSNLSENTIMAEIG